MKANRSEKRGTQLKHMSDYQSGMRNATGSEILSDFESLFSIGPLGSRELAIGERRIWVLGRSDPLLQKVTCLYFFLL